MVKIIEKNSCPEAWLEACTYLLDEKKQDNYSDYNIVLNVKSPLSEFSSNDKKIYNKVNNFLMAHDTKNLDTVAETIFPSSFYYPKKDKDFLFNKFPETIEKIKSGWGTYAMRMITQVDQNGEEFNPLDKIITKINRFPNRGKCLELGMIPFDADIQLYDPRRDKNRFLNGPCLSHISIKVVKSQTVNITALYRNHFYISKLFGNLIGISCLLDFICNETGLGAGEIIIHSTSAEIDKGGNWKLSEVKDLIAELNIV